MEYRFRVKSYAKLIVVLVALGGAIRLEVYLMVGINTVLGLLLIGGSGYVVYILLKYLIRHRASKIVSSEEGIRVNFYNEEEFLFKWEELRLFGLCNYSNGVRSVFLYNEEKDKFVEIPDSLGDFDRLLSEFKRHDGFTEITLNRGESLRERLRSLIE